MEEPVPPTDSPSAIRHPLSDWWWFIATWFGCGRAKYMSGTAGSLGALPFAYVIQSVGGNGLLFIASLVIFYYGTKASNLYLQRMQCDHDPKEIVVDEVAGQWLLLSFLYLSWHSYIAGFLLFRTFDIIKPWPVSVADAKIKGGFGVMFDDILAGLYPVAVYVVALGAAYCFGEEKLIYDWLSSLM